MTSPVYPGGAIGHKQAAASNDEFAVITLKNVARLTRIETRFEAWLVIYAIALGAIERGRVYIGTYPGSGGWLLALACTTVVFIAGGKLLDSVSPRHEHSRERCR
jgi:hypothetical protein